MAKMTLLEMTQNILSAMDSDEVNSITDTIESTQVSEVIRETYYEIIDNLDIPSQESLILLDALTDLTKPNYLKLPDTVDHVKWIKYDYETDGATDYTEVSYLKPEQFLIYTTARAGQADTIEVTDFSGGRLWILNNENPHYWTTFDNTYVVFDSYNSDLDSTLQQSKSLCWGQLYPDFEMDDYFIPTLESNMFSKLLAEAKSVCFFNFKQVTNPKEEQKSRRQLVRSQNNRWKFNQRKPYDMSVDYGRRHRY